jgi:molybdopterin synthase sulfur carrier subunit
MHDGAVGAYPRDRPSSTSNATIEQAMSITVKYFASLAEELGRREDRLPVERSEPVLQVWQRATGREQMPANVLVALNQEYVQRDAHVNDGDEIAFFPPVTGG